MDKRTKLNNVYKRLTKFDDNIGGTFESLDKEMANVTAKLKETVTAKTLEQVNEEFKRLTGLFKPLLGAFEELKSNLGEREKALVSTIDQKIKDSCEELELLVDQCEVSCETDCVELRTRISKLESSISELRAKKVEIPDFGSQIKESETRLKKFVSDVEESLSKDIKSSEKTKKLQSQIDDLSETLGKLRDRFNERGGGAMNRKISINGTVISTRYTDINFLGNGVAYSAVDNNVTKQVDLTLTASGTGGSGYQIPLTGTVNGVNKTYTWTTAPNALVVDGLTINAISSDGTVNWVGTTSTVLTIAPNFNVFAIV